MTYTLTANHAELEDDGFSLTLAFADENMGESGYVMLQKGLQSDEQDKKFGFDKVHIEIGSQNKSGYGGISRMVFSDAMLRIELNEKGQKFLQIENDVLIDFSMTDPRLEEKLRQFSAAIEGEFPVEFK